MTSKVEDEPDAHCVNCDSWAEAPAGGGGICLKINEPTNPADGCVLHDAMPQADGRGRG